MSRLNFLQGRPNSRLRFGGDSERVVPSARFDEATDLVAALADRALGVDATGASDLVDALMAGGLSAETICLDLIEPAARRLGDSWARDDCTDLDVTLAVCRLQTLVRQLGSRFARPTISPPARRRCVLMATQPGEPHMLGVALASEFYWQAGWDVVCEYPTSDHELCGLVRDRRFDALHLSLSSVFRRDHLLPAMTATIRRARVASNNADIVVLVNGKVFFDRPEWSVLVGADAVSNRPGQAVALTDRLLQSKDRSAQDQVSEAIADVRDKLVRRARNSTC